MSDIKPTSAVFRAPVEGVDHLTKEERFLAMSGKRISAIKMVRDRTHMTLVDAKNLVESSVSAKTLMNEDQYAWLMETFHKLLFVVAQSNPEYTPEQVAARAMAIAEHSLAEIENYNEKLRAMYEMQR